MYVDISKVKQGGKTYTRALIRESYREGRKVKHRTIANISSCSPEEILAIKLALKYKGNLSEMIPDKGDIHEKQGLSVGAVIAFYQIAQKLGIVKALGSTRMAKLALWMSIARIIYPKASRLEMVRLAQRHAAVDVMALDDFTEDDLYRALDWAANNQKRIENRLFKNRCAEKKPELFLYDVSSTYLEGTENELSTWGYDRDKKKGKMIIVFGLLTDEEGWPIAIEVFEGNTKDTKTFKNQIEKVKMRFGCERVTIVGDKGMIKSKQIEDLLAAEFYYITSITKPEIGTLINQNAIQIELFTENICEMEYDEIRYILRRNPVRAKELEKTRNDKIRKIEHYVQDRNQYLAEHPRAVESVAIRYVEEMIEKLKVSTFLSVESTNRILSLKYDSGACEKDSRLDGCYVVKSNVPKDKISSEIIHQRYKDLANVERAFRYMKTYLLEIRPVYVWKESRTRGHVFLVMLAYSIVKYLQERWFDIDIKIKEGIDELVSVNCIETTVGVVTYNMIPEPRDLGLELLNAIDVKLPPVIKCSGINVATRKKLTHARKKK